MIYNEDELGTNSTVPQGYGRPSFGVGDAKQAGLNPDQTLTAGGVDMNAQNGYQIGLGEADEPIDEYTAAMDNPSQYPIGKPSPAPFKKPSLPSMSSTPMQEDDELAFDENGDVIMPEGNCDNGVCEADDNFIAAQEQDVGVYEADLPIDEDGAMIPETVPTEVEEDDDLGIMPDVDLPPDEPVVEMDVDDVDVELPLPEDDEDIFEDGEPTPYIAQESFKLPEDARLVVSKGDSIYLLGKVKETFRPAFAESAFSRAVNKLNESASPKHKASAIVVRENVVLVGRSALVEVGKDWKLPGSNVIFEKHDLLQIVSAKPIKETEGDVAGESEDDIEEEKKKAERVASIAYRRWKEAEKKRKEIVGDDDKKAEDDDEEAKAKEDDEVKDDDKKKGDKKEKDNDKKEESFSMGNGYI